MELPRVTRTEVVAAVIGGIWAAVSFAPEGVAPLALAPILAAAALGYRRRPEVATLVVAAVSAAAAALGVSGENPATLAGGLTVVYGLGRYAGPRGLALVVVLALGLVVPFSGGAVVDLVFVSVVLGLTWSGGALVRRRTAAAERATALAGELAQQDPDALARAGAAEERTRLAGEALAVVRGAVATMRGSAAGAAVTLDPAALEAVQQSGRTAVTDLRRLLGLLRSEPESTPTPRPATRAARPRRLPPRADLLAAVGLAAVLGAELAVWGPERSAASGLLTLAVIGAVAMRGLDATLACASASLPSLVALAVDDQLVYGFALGAAAALLAWSAGALGRPAALAALALFAASTGGAAHVAEPGNEAILVVTVGAAALAGRQWGARGRETVASELRAARLRAEHVAAAERAVRAERLRLARELHDVASHAVGIMVLQAGAASALRERDPDAARAAVREVRLAGAQAMAELDVLFGVLDAGAVGSPGIATEAELDLGPALGALVSRLRATGMDVDLSLPATLDARGDTAAAALRVVQEALTNAARYARGSRVSVGVRDLEGTLVVDVRDDGPGATGHEPGFGLVGLEERVRALGGELTAGPRVPRGFAVTARLPHSERAAASA